MPATALGWSHKYEELFALFGWTGSVAAHEQIDEACLLASADEAWRERAARRAHLASETPALRNRLESLFDEVAQSITSHSQEVTGNLET